MSHTGPGPFENEDAQNFLAGLASLQPAALRQYLQAAAHTDEDDYLEASAGAVALVAAELVVAALGKPHPMLPDTAQRWVAHHGSMLTDADRTLGTQAVARVIATESELAEIWADEGGAAWNTEVRRLITRMRDAG